MSPCGLWLQLAHQREAASAAALSEAEAVLWRSDDLAAANLVLQQRLGESKAEMEMVVYYKKARAFVVGAVESLVAGKGEWTGKGLVVLAACNGQQPPTEKTSGRRSMSDLGNGKCQLYAGRPQAERKQETNLGRRGVQCGALAGVPGQVHVIVVISSLCGRVG